MHLSSEHCQPESANRDRKRLLFLWSLALPLVPSLAIALFFSPLGVWATLIPALFLYVAVPIVDAIIGEDAHNPDPSAAQEMANDAYYGWLVKAAVPLVWISFTATVALVGTQDLPLWSIAALICGVGSISGNAITIGHELGHKNNKLDQILAMWSNAVVGYAHFRVEHNKGHHVLVSTPKDPASARMGEPIYRFALREVSGALKSGWSIETARLKKRGRTVISSKNEILRGFAITVSAAALLTMIFGWSVLPFIVLHHMFGWYALTQANYVEHYGLLRQKRENGRYEPCRPHHSWNSNHTFSNLLTFHLQRHSDHHSHPMRAYQLLRDFPDLPRLPSGYPGMFVLAAIPPLWFRVMDKRVMQWADGDLNKANVCPRKRTQIEEKWQTNVQTAKTSAT